MPSEKNTAASGSKRICAMALREGTFSTCIKAVEAADNKGDEIADAALGDVRNDRYRFSCLAREIEAHVAMSSRVSNFSPASLASDSEGYPS